MYHLTEMHTCASKDTQQTDVLAINQKPAPSFHHSHHGNTGPGFALQQWVLSIQLRCMCVYLCIREIIVSFSALIKQIQT